MRALTAFAAFALVACSAADLAAIRRAVPTIVDAVCELLADHGGPEVEFACQLAGDVLSGPAMAPAMAPAVFTVRVPRESKDEFQRLHKAK